MARSCSVAENQEWRQRATLYSALAFYACLAAAQPATFKVGNQSFEIVPAFERQTDYIATLRLAGDTNLAQLYAKLVSTPVFDDCAARGEYSDLGRFNIAAPPSDLRRLAGEIETLRNGRLQRVLEEGLRKGGGPAAWSRYQSMCVGARPSR